MALALSGRNLKGKHNNQPSVGTSDGRESGVVACGGWSAGGNTIPLFGMLNGAMQKQLNKIHGGINWPPIGGPKHNNQPKTGGRKNGGWHGEDV